MQARVALAGGEERVGQQVGALLAGQPPGVEDAQLARRAAATSRRAGEKRATSTPRSQRPMRSASMPIPRRTSSEAGLGLRTTLALPVEGGDRGAGDELELGVGRAQPRVGGQLGVVGAEDRHLHDARDDRGGHARRAGAAEVHEVVAALGQRLDDRRQRRHADLQAGVERDVDLGDGAQPAVDVGVGADDLDLEAGHAALADLVERVGDAVHPADRVGHQRDAQRLALARHELALLAAEEGGRGRVRDRRHAGVEEAGRGGAEVAAGRRGAQRRRRPRPRACARARGGRGGRGRRG